MSKSTKTNIDRILFTCPACQVQVTGRITLELDIEPFSVLPDASESVSVNATGKVIGVYVSHDCSHRVTR